MTSVSPRHESSPWSSSADPVNSCGVGGCGDRSGVVRHLLGSRCRAGLFPFGVFFSESFVLSLYSPISHVRKTEVLEGKGFTLKRLPVLLGSAYKPRLGEECGGAAGTPSSAPHPSH